MNNTKFLSVMLAFAILIGLSSVTQQAEAASTYTLTIPSTLTVNNSGWNELQGGIQASGTLDSGKTLVIIASSDNNFNFVNSDDNTQTISYNFCASSSNLTPVTSWDFTSSTIGTPQTVGINVADYSNKPHGTYKETVTFTASLETTAGK